MQPEPRPSQRSPAAVAISAVICAALLAFAVFGLVGGGEHRRDPSAASPEAAPAQVAMVTAPASPPRPAPPAVESPPAGPVHPPPLASARPAGPPPWSLRALPPPPTPRPPAPPGPKFKKWFERPEGPVGAVRRDGSLVKQNGKHRRHRTVDGPPPNPNGGKNNRTE